MGYSQQKIVIVVLCTYKWLLQGSFIFGGFQLDLKSLPFVVTLVWAISYIYFIGN